jgi:hypothetical protein
MGEEYKSKLNPYTGQLQLVSTNIVLAFKAGVASQSNLPLTGNSKGDARIANDTGILYVWSIVDSSGLLTDWISSGDIVDLDWAAISNKPSSSVAAIDQAVTDDHTHSNKTEIDKVSDGDHDVRTDNPHSVTKTQVGLSDVDNKSEATIITDVKADSDVASAISLKHTQNTDAKLDEGGLNEVAASDIKTHIDSSSGIHGITGSVVGSDDGQTLTNKMIIGADTIKGQYRDVSIFPYPFTSVSYFDGVGYTDLTDEAKTIAGTPFNVLADNNDIFYVAIDNLNYWYGEIYLGLSTVGVGLNLVVEYFNEEDNWVDIGLIDDGTLNLTQSGKLFYNNPSDWKMATVNGYLGYFVRIRTTTNPSQVPTAFVVSPYETVFGVQSQEGDGLVYPIEVKADGKIIIRTVLTDEVNTVSIADIKDAIDKEHVQGTDQGLDTGGANATTAADIKDAVDKKHSNSLDHTQGTDQGLDTGGANEISAANAKAAYTHSGVTTGNPHAVTKTEVGLSDVTNDAQVKASQLKRATFVNGDLSTGKLTITHSLALSAPYSVIVAIFDNNSKQIIPDDITGATNTVEIDLTSFGTLSGTWGYLLLG